MTYDVFGGTLSLTQSINHYHVIMLHSNDHVVAFLLFWHIYKFLYLLLMQHSTVSMMFWKHTVVVWRWSQLSSNKVNLRRALLVLGWVTVSGFNCRCRTFISVCNQPPRPTQPGHPFVGRRNETSSGDALWLGSKGRYGSCVCGR